MFSLDGTMRFWLYSRPVSMRMGFFGLSGIVHNRMGMDVNNGDVFVFMNANRDRMKILHREDGGLVLYSLCVDIGRMKRPWGTSDDDVLSSSVSHDELIRMVMSSLDSPYVRRMRLLAKKV